MRRSWLRVETLIPTVLQTYPCPSLLSHSNQCQDLDFATTSAKHIKNIKRWLTSNLIKHVCLERILWWDATPRTGFWLLPLLMCLSPSSCLRFCSWQTNAGHEDNHQDLIWCSLENETILLWLSNIGNLSQWMSLQQFSQTLWLRKLPLNQPHVLFPFGTLLARDIYPKTHGHRPNCGTSWPWGGALSGILEEFKTKDLGSHATKTAMDAHGVIPWKFQVPFALFGFRLTHW